MPKRNSIIVIFSKHSKLSFPIIVWPLSMYCALSAANLLGQQRAYYPKLFVFRGITRKQWLSAIGKSCIRVGLLCK